MRDNPPKRLSVIADSPHYDLATALKCKAFLDGKPVVNCIAYDQVEGWVDTFKTDADGKLVITGPELEIERFTGCVSVDWID